MTSPNSWTQLHALLRARRLVAPVEPPPPCPECRAMATQLTDLERGLEAVVTQHRNKAHA
jgi:hypothetical protein